MLRPVIYRQDDSRWGKNDYSAEGEKKTIESSGCGPTCAAMIIQTLRPDLKITPADTAEWSKQHNYKILNQGTSYGYFTDQFREYGISCSMMNSNDMRFIDAEKQTKLVDKIRQALITEGQFVIACMGPGNWGDSGHFVIAYKMDSCYVYINDPKSSADYREKCPSSLFFSEIKHFWIISWGAKTQIQTKGLLYAKNDIKSKKLEDLWASYTVWQIKDVGNGWSIICTENNVGYCKNSKLRSLGNSSYPESSIIESCFLKSNSSIFSKKLLYIAKNAVVNVITAKKHWSYVSVSVPYSERLQGSSTFKGWIKTKFLDNIQRS